MPGIRSFVAALVVMSLAAAVIATAASACFEQRRTTTLTGAAESPAADPDGTGRATIGVHLKEGLVCWSITVRGIVAANAAHIHKAPAGTNGPVVVPLGTPAGGASKGCIGTGRALIRDIVANPAQYYVNVHNRDYPAGAIRGQLGT